MENTLLLNLYFTVWALRNVHIYNDSKCRIITNDATVSTELMSIDQLYDWFIDNVINGSPVIIEWPESQLLMEEPWFDQCTLINTDEGISKHGSSAYEVPQFLYFQHTIPLSFVNR